MTAVALPAVEPERVIARDLVDIETWRGLVAAAGPADLLVDIALHTHERADGSLYPTVGHGAVRRYTSLWITSTVILDGLSSRPHQSSAALLDRVTPRLAPADWTALRALWSTWHAQSLSPGCEHQSPPEGADVAEALATVADCKVGDGYRFGSAMLVRELPRDIVERARQLGAALEARQ